jgi:hypothetical protein
MAFQVFTVVKIWTEVFWAVKLYGLYVVISISEELNIFSFF